MLSEENNTPRGSNGNPLHGVPHDTTAACIILIQLPNLSPFTLYITVTCVPAYDHGYSQDDPVCLSTDPGYGRRQCLEDCPCRAGYLSFAQFL